jgi:hypothetical protein
VTGWFVATLLPIVAALVLAHFAERTDDAMDYDGGRPTPPTAEQAHAQQLGVGVVASSIASRS